MYSLYLVVYCIYRFFCVCVCCFHLPINPERGNEFTRMSQRGCILPERPWLQLESQWKPVKTNWIQVALKNLRLDRSTSLSWSLKVNGRFKSVLPEFTRMSHREDASFQSDLDFNLRANHLDEIKWIFRPEGPHICCNKAINPTYSGKQ